MAENFILITDVKIKSRQRKTMDKVKFESTKTSIREEGLLHAIVLNHKDELIVGERRLRIMTELHSEGVMFYYNGRPVPKDKVPFTRNWVNDEVIEKEIELNENIQREELPWPDRVAAVAEIHRLKAAKNPEQSFTQTAKEIVEKKGSGNAAVIAQEVSRSLITTDFLDRPEVKSARNEKEAFNAAIRILRSTFAARIPVKPSNHEFIEGEATTVLETLLEQKRTYSCFILDPPYGVNAQTFVNKTDTQHSYDDSPRAALRLNASLIYACSKLATPNSHLWLFCDVDYFRILRRQATKAGWLVFPTPIVWNSGVRGHIPNQKIGIRRNHEFLMFAMKGDRGLAKVFDDVINGIPGGTIEYHAAEKPRLLYELLLSLSCLPGDRVLDPCCGSGTIFRAANNRNLSATGVDNNPEYAAFCRSVIAELSQTPEEKETADDLGEF